MCKRGGGGEESVVMEDHKGMLITENCKNIHNGHGHSVSWQNHCE